MCHSCAGLSWSWWSSGDVFLTWYVEIKKGTTKVCNKVQVWPPLAAGVGCLHEQKLTTNESTKWCQHGPNQKESGCRLTFFQRWHSSVVWLCESTAESIHWKKQKRNYDNITLNLSQLGNLIIFPSRQLQSGAGECADTGGGKWWGKCPKSSRYWKSVMTIILHLQFDLWH